VQIIYDFQERYKNYTAGKFIEDDFITIRHDAAANFNIADIEDIKSLQITERENREAGIYIKLQSIEGLLPGDRLTITGRIGENPPSSPKWSVALFCVSEGHSPHLTHHPSPQPIFAISYIVEEKDLNATFTVHAISWGSTEPDMDIYIDDIVITRHDTGMVDEIDPRKVIYSLAEDENITPTIVDLYDENGPNANILRNGDLSVRVFKHNGANAIQASNRVKDWDGIDICIENFKLLPGNSYKVSVCIQLDEPAPLGTIFMLQGIPGYDWRGNTVVQKETDFTLHYVLSRVEVEKWHTIRITTNPPGASVSFCIHSIDIVRI